MGKKLISAKRVISGSKGKLYLDGEYVAGVISLSAKVTANKEDVYLDNTTMIDQKVISLKGTGSVELEKISSFMQKQIGEAMREGRDVRFTIRSELNDPDAFGAERVEIRNVSFDEVDLINWTKGKKTTGTYPFTFSDWGFIDEIVEDE